jgi:hypothetical protein
LAAALLAWGLWGLPEAAGLRLWWSHARASRSRRAWWAPAGAVAACIVAGALVYASTPDGSVRVERLSVGSGQAVFIRGPTGRTALVVGGKVDAARLASQVADQLAIWEHKLDCLVRLDPTVDASLGLTLARFPAESRLTADRDARLELGGSAVLDIYAAADAEAQPAVSVTFGDDWLALSGQPPPPAPNQLR